MTVIKPARTGGAGVAGVLGATALAALWNLGRRAARVGGPPFAAFAAGWLVVAGRVPGGWRAAFDPSSWAREDSGQYLRIARAGYLPSAHCDAATYPKTALPGRRVCGNTTWFAGYPALIRALSITGVSLMVAGLVIGWLSWYLTLLMIWLLSSPEQTGFLPCARRWACLLLAAVFPGQVYFAAIFPISLTTFGVLASIYFATRLPPRRWPALTSGVAAGSAYLASVAALPGLALALLRRGREHRTTLAFAAAGLCLGVLAVLGYAQLAVGHWDAYFTTERVEYRVGLHNPVPALAARFDQLWPLPPSGASRTIAEQTIVVWLVLALAVIGLAACFAIRRRPHPSSADAVSSDSVSSDVVLLVAALVGWLIPYVGGGALSVYRAEAMVIVAVPLLRRVPTVVTAALIVLATSVAWHMAPLFFSRRLV